MINRVVGRICHLSKKYFWNQISKEEVVAQLWYYLELEIAWWVVGDSGNL